MRTASTPAAASAAPSVRPAPSQGDATVLLVDDEAAVRKVTRRLLERAGFRVLEAGDPAEALAVARAFAGPIDLLLTDVVMPGMNGNQLAVHLWEERPGIRVLFMSGYSQDDAVRWGVTGPGHAFVEKPFSSTTLPRAVEAALATPAGH